MEGCPRSSMLSIDLKDSIPAEFTDSIKKYITDHYQEDPENYKHECQQIEQLRSACLHPGHDHSGCSTLRRYFSQLQYLQSRFPMVDGGAVSVQFTWTDLYSEESIALADVRFEQAAILHNLGALHSQLGAQEDRTGEEGMKVACTHFQAAAGIFQYLKNTVMVPLASMKLPWVSEDHFAVPFFDLASCVLQLYINILLGQAQECLLEKSILDGRKDSLIARISMQVYDYYQQALGILESLGSSYLGSKKSKMWTKAVKIKACHFTCVSYIHMSNHAHENQKFGEKVAYLKAAHQKLTEAQKQSKGQPERTLELLQFMADVVNNKLEGAVKDNDFIFHEVVPDLAALPVIKGASLVKPIPFQPCDPSVAGPDIFQRLIPMEAHTDASIYSEEKAKLLRRYNASIDVKNKQLAQSLASLHIDDLLQPVETDTLPTLLKEKHDTLSKDVVLLSQTEENIEESSKLSDDVENTLKSISSMLDEDEKKEKLAQGGKQETTQEREDIRKEYEKCQEAFSKANHTNNELARVYKAHRQNLELIAGSEEQLLAALPSLNIIDSPVDDGAVQRLRDLIAKVEEMKVQRKSLEEDLRNKLNEDDITGLLVTRDGNKMAFFDQQLKKHDTACSLIQANLDAQDKILSALTEANAKYAKTRQAVKESTQRREEVVQALILSYNTFCELQGKLSRGVDFYKRLSSTVRKLEEKCKNFFDNHSKELDKLIEKKKVTTEPPKPPSRPSAAKPDHLVRPQQPHPPPSSIVVLPGQPPNLIGPSSIANMPPGVHPQHYVPRQPIPPSLPRHPTPPSSLPYSVPQTHIPADQAIHTPPRMSYPFPDSQRQIQVSEPGQFPRHSVPGQVSPAQGLPRLPFQNQVLPNQQPTGINTSLSQVRPERPSHVASFQQPDILGGQQQFPGQSMTRPQVPQSVQPPQPDLISQVRPQFPGQFVPGQRMPFHRPESPQSPMGQLPTPPRPQAQSTSPVPLQPRLSSMSHPRHPPATHPQHFQPGSLTSSSVHQQINPVQPGQLHLRPEQPSQAGLSPQFQPRQPFNQQFRPGQPLQPSQIHRHPFHQGLQTQVRPSSPSQQQFRPELLSQQQFRPQQASQQFPPHQSQQQFRPQSPQQSLRPQILQTQYRPEQLPQQPQQFRPQLIRPDQPTKQQQQQFQPQNISQQQFRPQSAQPSLRPQQQQHNQQFRPEQTPSQQFQPQQPIIPQRPSQPQFGSQQTSHLQQPLQQQFRSQQLPQGPPQSFQVSQQSQLPPSSFPQPIQTVRQGPNLPQPLLPEQFSNKQEQTPLQPFRPGLSSQQPFRPDQSLQQTFRPELTSQQPFRPDQSSQQPVRPELSSQQPFRPDQSPKPTFRPELTSQQPSRPGQSSQQPFRPNQSSQQPFRPELSSQQPFRPDQSSQHSVQPELTSQQPFRANQSSQQPVRPDLPSQQPFRPQRLSQQPFRPDQSSQEPVRPELSSQQPFRPDQTSQQSTRPDQSSQRPFPLDKQQPSSQQGPSHSLTQDQQQLPSTFRPESSFQNLPQNPLFQQGSEQRTFQVDQQPDANLNNQASRPLVEPTHRIDAEPQHQTFSNPNVSQSFSRQTSSAIAHSYPETGAFIANPSSLPSSYGSWQAPSLINQGSRPFPSSVTSSDYLTSFSVALAQNQLSQYQNSSSQQQMQQFQQQLMLQQQQLILQQQEMLKQQQSQQHTHDSDQVQIGLLLQQILQQQKQLTDLEMKIKEKSENQVKHDNIESSATNNTDDEKKLTPPEQQIVKKKESSLIQVEKVESTKSDSKPSLSALTPSEDHKSAGVVKTDNKNSSGAFLPDYASVGKWFSDLSITPIVGKTNADAKGSDEKTTKDCESEHGSNKNDHVESVVEHEEDHKHEPFKEENDNTQKLETIELKPESEEFELEEFEPEPVKSDLTSEDDDDDIYLKNDEIPHVEDDKETPKIEKDPHEDEEMEEDRRRTMEEQIKQIKELQNKPPVHVTSTFYEPGQVPTSRRNEPVSCPTDEEDTKPSLLRQCGHYYASQISSIDQTTNNSCLNSDEELQALVSAVKGFDLVVKSLSADKHGSGLDGFSIEWRELERLQEYDSASKTANAGTMNQPKNRYKDILPWDHTRVKLTFKDESDYINANFVKNITPLSPSFIATQGPIATTLTDFWLMIWEQQSNIVIMLTREVEGNKLMCHQYWPIDEGHTVLFGPIRVLLKTVITSPLSVKRVMHVQHTDSDDTLIVTHLQFCGWPDKGVPETSVDLLSFVNVARSCYQQSLKESEEKPIIVHCSAGIGRTGTFIVLYSAIQEFNANREFVNIPRLVRNLRLHRKYMVQKQEQYEFCYKTLLFYARQFLDLELASLTPQRRASLNLGQLEPHPVGKNAPIAEDNRPRKGSNDARFIGELKADDSLETNDEEDNKTEQSISEKYCKGTLETDAEGTRKKKKSTDRSESTESTAQQSTTDTGKVSIGKDEEVRFIKDEENDLETEELETQIDEQKSEEEQSSLESTALEDNNSDAKANTSAVQAVDRDEMTFGTDTGTKNNDSATIEEQDSCKDDVHSELKTESETEESLQTKNEET